jgi:histidine triad (HIT) family protein
VFHLHVHLVPRFSGQSPGLHATNQADAAELEELQARLRQRLQG